MAANKKEIELNWRLGREKRERLREREREICRAREMAARRVFKIEGEDKGDGGSRRLWRFLDMKVAA